MNGSAVEAVNQQPPRTVWGSLPVSQRRFVLAAIIIAFSQLILVDVFFRIQELPQINQYLAGAASSGIIDDGIQYPPFVVSAVACGLLLGGSVVLVNSRSKEGHLARSSWLGSAWVLASFVLVLDLTIDTFELKWPIIILFAYVGLRYWRGASRNYLGLALAPSVLVIAGLDGLNHLGGQDCVSAGLDACPGKAVSDLYLVLILLLLAYMTLKGHDKGPVS